MSAVVTNSPAAAHPGWRWIVSMAWRDSRGNRGLLGLFMLSVVFGIGAIVAILSLRINLAEIINQQTKALLGADVVLQTYREPTAELQRFLASLPGQRTGEVRLRSMVRFPDSGAAVFAQVRAIDGAYPFYGEIESDPRDPQVLVRLAGWRQQAEQMLPVDALPPVLVEQSLLLQQNLEIGSIIQIGDARFAVSGSLLRIAGESEITGFFAPRIYIPMTELASTGLVQPGSVIRYRSYHAFSDEDKPRAMAMIVQAQRSLFVDTGVRMETVEDRRRNVERVLGNLFDFLNWIGFTALLLGGIGIGGAVHVFLKTKVRTIAVLRCLGTPVRAAFAIYLTQISIFGMGASLMGAGTGIATQFALPVLLSEFLPFQVEVFLAPAAILPGLLFGWLTATLFALLPLLSLRRISPLQALRTVVDLPAGSWKDPLRWCVLALTVLCLGGFTLLNARSVWLALAFVGGLGVALLCLTVVAMSLRWGLRRFIPIGSPYALRLAMGNLYRPNNRTLLLLVTMGMGVVLLNALFLAQQGLLQQVRVEGPGDAPNAILLDVQPDQLDDTLGLLAELGLPAAEVLPVVTMRVSAIKGRSLREWRADPDSPLSEWVYSWEFRNTYRDHVLDNATVVAGEFISQYDGLEPFPVSLSENVLDDLGVTVGDSITWDVQGIPLETYVASVRRIQWQAGRQNFNVVFPVGTIEEAPTVFAIAVRSGGRADTAGLQARLGALFPNVSLLDLSMVFDTIQEILNRAAFVIQFMALFTIATGVLVLAGAILSSRYQRLRESVLFRTIGASGSFIRNVLAYEFLVLGFMASASGLLLSYAAAWALLNFVFKLPLVVDLASSLALAGGMMALTLLTGWLTSRGIAGAPPLAILRKEGE